MFKAELPFSDQIPYLRYHLASWPVFQNTSKTWIKLNIPTDVAFHTRSGGIFQPHHCLGSRPAICPAGPVYDRTTFHCARGILANEQELRSHTYNNILHQSVPIGTLYIIGHVLCGTALIAHVSRQTYYMTQTRAIASTRACINTSVHSTVAQMYYICAPSHSSPQDLSKSEKRTETGTHRTNQP